MADNKKKYEDEINFRALLNNPKRLFGWIFPYFFLLLLILGVFYVHNLSEMSLKNVPVNPPIEEDNVKRAIEKKKGSVTDPIDLSIIQDPSQELISKGQELYEQNCASCHGNKGLGDGTAGAALNPPPRDFTSTGEWTNGRNFIDMYKTLQEGIPENGMTAYEYIPPKDRIAMIHYVRTFADFPEITDDEVQELNSTYSLSKGVQTANQIPVDTAIDRLLKEKTKSQTIYNLIDFVNNHPNMEGAEVFGNVVQDKYRVFSSFASSSFNEMELEEFVEIASSNFNELGFSAGVSRLEQNEWQSLFNYLKNVLGTATS